MLCTIKNEKYLIYSQCQNRSSVPNKNNLTMGLNQESNDRDFPGGPGIKNSPSKTGDVDWCLVGEQRSHIYHRATKPTTREPMCHN